MMNITDSPNDRIIIRCGLLIIYHPLINSWSITWPFAKVEIEDDGILLNSVVYRHWIRRSEIVDMSVVRSFLGKGVYFKLHPRHFGFQSLVIWPWSMKRLCEGLERRGYSIAVGSRFLYWP